MWPISRAMHWTQYLEDISHQSEIPSLQFNHRIDRTSAKPSTAAIAQQGHPVDDKDKPSHNGYERVRPTCTNSKQIFRVACVWREWCDGLYFYVSNSKFFRLCFPSVITCFFAICEFTILYSFVTELVQSARLIKLRSYINSLTHTLGPNEHLYTMVQNKRRRQD